MNQQFLFHKLELRFDPVSDNKVEWLFVMLIIEMHISLGTLGKMMILLTLKMDEMQRGFAMNAQDQKKFKDLGPSE